MNEKLRKILSIDDSRAVHAFLDKCAREVSSFEYEFIHAMGVKEALSIIEKSSAGICAIFLDWEMPEISGFEGLPLLKKVAPKIPVVILTSKNDASRIAEMLGRGASEYMMKPFTPDILKEKLEMIRGEIEQCSQI